jgi:hypothetical protein
MSGLRFATIVLFLLLTCACSREHVYYEVEQILSNHNTHFAADNKKPTIILTASRTIKTGQQLTLEATVIDDGKPLGKLFPQWEFIKGPAAPLLDQRESLSVRVNFTEPGLYQFQFNVDDGALSATEHVTVLVGPYSGQEVSDKKSTLLMY